MNHLAIKHALSPRVRGLVETACDLDRTGRALSSIAHAMIGLRLPADDPRANRHVLSEALEEITRAYLDARDALVAALAAHGLETHMLEERECVADMALSGLRTEMEHADDATRSDDYGADTMKEER